MRMDSRGCQHWVHTDGLVEFCSQKKFFGTGAPSRILIAAERTGRKARAIEIDPVYVDVAVRRWQTYTGKSAILLSSGEEFEIVEEQRGAQPLAA
jgi:hypothetical protein